MSRSIPNGKSTGKMQSTLLSLQLLNLKRFIRGKYTVDALPSRLVNTRTRQTIGLAYISSLHLFSSLVRYCDFTAVKIDSQISREFSSPTLFFISREIILLLIFSSQACYLNENFGWSRENHVYIWYFIKEIHKGSFIKEFLISEVLGMKLEYREKTCDHHDFTSLS